jgi:hypothetical protein
MAEEISNDPAKELGGTCVVIPTNYELLRAAMRHISDIWENLYYEEGGTSPFRNHGTHRFDNGVFEVVGYDWDDDSKQEWNFRWKDIKIRWYKHCLRGLEVNRLITNDEISQMVEECVDAIDKDFDKLVYKI